MLDGCGYATKFELRRKSTFRLNVEKSNPKANLLPGLSGKREYPKNEGDHEKTIDNQWGENIE